MPQYRKKPVVIEARQWNPRDDNSVNNIVQWLGENKTKIALSTIDNTLTIRTLEGDMKADDGDYIIKGVKGEFYPCKPDIFTDTYEEVINEE